MRTRRRTLVAKVFKRSISQFWRTYITPKEREETNNTERDNVVMERKKAREGRKEATFSCNKLVYGLILGQFDGNYRTPIAE